MSINKTLTLLRQVLAAGVRYGYLDRNPVDDVDRLKVGKRAQPFLQLDQIPALVAATDERYRPLLWTLLLAGLRIGEALALWWSDVKFLADSAGSQHRPDVGTRLVSPRLRSVVASKGRSRRGEEGSVAIGEFLVKTLLDHKERSPFDGENDLVFPTSMGNHQSPSNFRRRALAPAVENPNIALRSMEMPIIPAITHHSLRHTYCSLLIAQGEDLATVADYMRHSDQTTTLKIYTHVMKHRRKGVTERLDQPPVRGHLRHRGRGASERTRVAFPSTRGLIFLLP